MYKKSTSLTILGILTSLLILIVLSYTGESSAEVIRDENLAHDMEKRVILLANNIEPLGVSDIESTLDVRITEQVTSNTSARTFTGERKTAGGRIGVTFVEWLNGGRKLLFVTVPDTMCVNVSDFETYLSAKPERKITVDAAESYTFELHHGDKITKLSLSGPWYVYGPKACTGFMSVENVAGK